MRHQRKFKSLETDIKKKYAKDVEKAYGIKDKLERQTAVGAVRDEAIEEFTNEEKGIDCEGCKQ